MDKQLDAGQGGDDLDLLVLRQLSALPGFEPRRGFADRVMAGVVRPRPAALVKLQRAGAWVAQPARALTLAAAYAFSVAIVLRLSIPWVESHGSAFSLGATWLVGRVGALLDAAVAAAAAWAIQSGVAGAVRSAALAGDRLWGAIAAITLGYAICGYGLHLLLKTPGRTDAALARTL